MLYQQVQQTCRHSCQKAYGKTEYQRELSVGDVAFPPGDQSVEPRFFFLLHLTCMFKIGEISLTLISVFLYSSAYLMIFTSPFSDSLIMLDGVCGLCSCLLDQQT